MATAPPQDDTLTGLSKEEVALRLQKHGPNAFDTEPPRTWAHRLLDMAREPMFMLLVAAALLYIVLGDLVEGLTLSLFVLAVLGMTCLLYTSPSPRDYAASRMPSSA